MRGIVVLVAIGAWLANLHSAAKDIPSGDPAIRLHSVRSLRCTFTAETVTKWTNGQRTITSEKLHTEARANEVTYDNIDINKGSARAIGSAGASDLSVRLDRMGAVWMVETVPAGFLVVTTVAPVYAAGSKDFIVIESRTSLLPSAFVLSTQDSGTCSVLD